MADVMLSVPVSGARREEGHALLKSGDIEGVGPLFSVSCSRATTKLQPSSGRGGWVSVCAGLSGRGGGRSLTSAGPGECAAAAGAGVGETAQVVDALAPLECSVPDLENEDSFSAL